MLRAYKSSPWSLTLVFIGLACSNGGSTSDATNTSSSTITGDGDGDETGGMTGDGDGDPGDGDGDGDPGDGDGDGEDGGIKFDMAPLPDGSDTDGPGELCKVVDEMNAVGDCEESAPPDAFEPDIQWDWWGPNGEVESLVPPLVANLTDDNDDGEIDLCDIPDVVVVATAFPNSAHIYVLDGLTGQLHFQVPMGVAWSITPAIGDIDDDGLPEIVAAIGPGFSGGGQIVAFEHDGTHIWTNDAIWTHSQGGSIALADLDNDGDVEIMGDRTVVDHLGNTVFVAPAQSGAPANTAVTAADLDGDGDLEVVLGQSAYHHDGTQVYANSSIPAGFPQIGNLDGDPQPEILVSHDGGITCLEHDGTIKYLSANPDGTSPAFRPAAIHDFDGDDTAEFAVSSSSVYSVYETTPSVLWSAPITDSSGWSGGTAFDFDGDGVAEAMYADEQNLFIFDGAGMPLLSVPRSARTLAEYPVVADVDNDGSAEIIVVSDAGFDNNQTAPTVQVIRDVEDRWIQARRIWNQHTYHVTNVREDGTIPQFEAPNWETLNTFRTNAQIEGGEICQPDPQG
jgi:hypothetical protein